jgi:hypothetical protein
MQQDTKPLSELRRDIAAAAIMLATVSIGAVLLHYWFL